MRPEDHPLLLLSFSVLVALLALGLLLREVKRSESRILTEWCRLRYLAHLLRTQAPPSRPRPSAEKLRQSLAARGLSAEILRDTPEGVEVELEVNWEDLSRLLALIYAEGLRVGTIRAEDPSGQGRFRVRLVVR